MRSLRPKMRRRLPAFLTLASTALAGAGLVGCSSEQASPSGCSPVGIAAVRETLPDSLAKSRLDSHSTDEDEHSFSVLYRAQDKEQVSLLGTKYEAEGAPVCPDDPNEAAQRYLELLHDDLDASLNEEELVLLADAQTSGGLLLIGEVPGYPVIGHTTERTGNAYIKA